MNYRTFIPVVVIMAGTISVSPGIDQQWLELKAAQDQAREVDGALRENSDLMTVIGDYIPARKNAELQTLRSKMEAARKAYDAAEDSALGQKKEKLQAAQKQRDDMVDLLLKDCAAYQKTLADIERLTAEVESVKPGRRAPSLKAVRALNQRRRELGHLTTGRYFLRKVFWERAEVKPLYEKAGGLYKSFHSARGGNKDVRAAEAEVRKTRNEWKQAVQRIVPETKTGKVVAAEREKLLAQKKELQTRIRELEKSLIGGNWTTHKIRSPGPRKDKEGKSREMTTTIWIPPDCERVRGLFVGFWSRLINDTFVRAAARESGLAIVRFDGFDGLFNYTTTAPKSMLGALEKVADVTKHPEIKNAPFLTAGMSTTVIGARNVAYWRPNRAIGVIHVAGGNMHQHCYDPALSLSGVPLFAENGEFEVYGPEGGIRPEYGMQTQWVMIREQILRRRKKDPAHLMSLAVQPDGGHGGWDRDLSILAGLFIIKAVERRVPAELPTGDKPVKCRKIKPQDGWLTDADIYAPKFEPAAYKDYKGDRNKTFWHLDEEMARAVMAYHKDKFFLPDPSEKQPVPADWPPRS